MRHFLRSRIETYMKRIGIGQGRLPSQAAPRSGFLSIGKDVRQSLDLGAPRAHVRHATHPGYGRGAVCCLPRPDRAEGRAFWRQAPKVIA
jgi:hypothetical protein